MLLGTRDPRGLKLNRQVYPIQGEGQKNTSDEIEKIIKTAENNILGTRVVHYKQVTETTTTQLMEVEQDLRGRPETERGKITTAEIQAEREEDKLQSSLERTRTTKLSKLREHHHLPLGRAFPDKVPRRLKQTSKPYQRRSSKRSTFSFASQAP